MNRLWALAMTAVLATAGGLASGQTAPLADRLPERSLLYVGWAGQTDALRTSSLGKLLDEPGVVELVGTVQSAVAQEIGRRDERQAAQALLGMAALAWKHPLAVSVVDVRVDAGGGPPAVTAVAMIDLGADRDAFDKHLQALLALAGEQVKTLAPPAPRQGQPPEPAFQALETPAGTLAVGYAGKLFVAVVGMPPGDVVSLAPAATLAKNARFADALKPLAGPDCQMAAYLDAAGVRAVLEKAQPAGQKPAVPAVLKALGLAETTAVGRAVNIVGGRFLTRTRIYSPAPHRGVLMLAAGPALAPKALAGIPADADAVAAFTFSPAAVLAEIRQGVEAVEPGASRNLDEALAQLRQQLQLDVEKDVLAHLGDQWTLVSAPSLGGAFTGTVLSVQLKDPAAFAASLGKLEAFAAGATQQGPLQLGSFQRDGRKVAYLWGRSFPLAPSWATAGDRLYVAAFPQVLLAAMAGPAEMPLVDAPAFAELRGKVAASPSGIVYVNVPALLRRVYALPLVGWHALIGHVNRNGGPALRPEMLPPLPTLERHLGGSIAAWSADKDGITLESFGSLPGGGGLLGPGIAPLPLWIGVLVPTMARARHNTREALSLANLNGIGKGLAMYQADFNDVFPPDFQTLIERGHIPPLMLQSPHLPRREQVYDGKRFIGPIDYVYLGNRLPPLNKLDKPHAVIVAYEPPAIGEPGSALVLTADGNIRPMAVRDFEKALADTQALLGGR